MISEPQFNDMRLIDIAREIERCDIQNVEHIQRLGNLGGELINRASLMMEQHKLMQELQHPTKESFETKCNLVSEKLDISVCFFDDDEMQLPFEDDGALHIVDKCGLRACFDVGQGQSLRKSQQNNRTRAVMRAMGLPIIRSVLV